MKAWTTIEVTDVHPHIAVLTMKRPDQRNAINATMADELEDCLTSLQDRPDLSVLIVTGAGSTFGASDSAIFSPPEVRM
ncbi:enoyl-CoA hydratase-related protein [Variovorax sp. J22P240]|uniref:enoyl-CoA hydratase/isomerase family protein n=1 Tax=Variovorax sp. J22P240 TaxID=3053514 RepID=UPI00257505AA|nr:enoyl-CoA hydratase-related protein [Variovorax sp. J22P240]MDL9997464.1 enoyl-CoA hydratase-related protein [Variovorax sp. J22P240]